MKHAIFLGVLLAVAVALVPHAGARDTAHRAATAARAAAAAKAPTMFVRPDPGAMKRVIVAIAHHRDETWRWQGVMQMHRTPYAGSVHSSLSLKYGTWVLKLWHRRALSARQQAFNPPHKAEWLCIHNYEGSWTDPNAPYYGGLQMDLEFQQTYGAALLRAKGTADHWSALEQMWVAERAYRTRGFWPWPNTARYCGLL